MKILITGGTGFIGKLLIAASADDLFTVVSRNPEQASQSFKAMPQVTACVKLNELEDLDGFDAIINLAGEPIIDKRWTAQQKSVIEESRWQTTSHLVNCFKQSDKPPAVFISGSAIGYYGEQGDHEITEQVTSHADDFSAKLCREWEHRANEISDPCRLVILRTGIVLHPDFGALQRMLLPFRLGLGGPIGRGEHYFSWIHWSDMVMGIRFLLTHSSARGAFNMTAPEPVTNKQFSVALGKALRRPAILPVPPLTLKLMLGEASELLTVSQRILPKALGDAGFEFDYTDIQSCLDHLVGDGS